MATMSDFQRLSVQEAAEVARRLRDLDWPGDPARMDALAAAFGWEIESRRELGARLGTRFGMATGEFVIDDGRIARLSAAVCSDIDDESAAESAWLQDVFAEVTGAVTDVLGEPTRQVPGDSPEVRWRGERSTVSLHRYSVIVEIALTENAYLDEQDEIVSRGL
jgi:hypothetical protein